MSSLISLRLPDELLQFVESEVGSGAEQNRSAVIVRALWRELRRRKAEQDVVILKSAETLDSDSFDALAEYSAKQASSQLE